jgi:hypothetical protein
MNELNEVSGNGSTGPVNGAIRPLGSAGRYIAPKVNRTADVRQFAPASVIQSDGGFNFNGVDSLGGTVKGFVQTEDMGLAANVLERGGFSVQSISERRGPRK